MLYSSRRTPHFFPETEQREHDVLYAVRFFFCGRLIRSWQIIIMIYWLRFHRNWISVRDTQQDKENDSFSFFLRQTACQKICNSFFDNDNINLQAHLSRNMIWKFRTMVTCGTVDPNHLCIWWVLQQFKNEFALWKCSFKRQERIERPELNCVPQIFVIWRWCIIVYNANSQRERCYVWFAFYFGGFEWAAEKVIDET